MKKSLFRTLMILTLTIGVHAKALDNAGNHNHQHDSLLKVKTVTRETVKKMQRHAQDAKTLQSQENDIAKQKNHAHRKFLSPPQIVDDRMDLEKTMKLMGKNFKALNKASELRALLQLAQNLEKWAAQAQALGLQEVRKQPATVKQRKGFEQGIIGLREQIAALKVAVEKEDQAGASLILKQLDEIRKQNHKLFK